MESLLTYNIRIADSPFWVFAIHDGHQMDPAIEDFVILDEQGRLREEDPYTASMAELPVNQIFVATSRFQLDLNRKREDAVYLRPEQAWGLEVFKDPLPTSLLEQLYEEHDAFYKKIDQHIRQTIDQHGYFVVFDVHSYNAKRISETEQIDPITNPQINVGTYYNSDKWRLLIHHFIASVGRKELLGAPIDIRENVKFKGGYLAQHILKNFAEYGCVLSIEFRKDFMNEWTGIPYQPAIQEYKQLLLHILKDLQKLDLHGV